MRRLTLITLVALLTVTAATAAFAQTISLTGTSALSSSAFASVIIIGLPNESTTSTTSLTSLPTAGRSGASTTNGPFTATDYDLAEAGFDFSFSYSRSLARNWGVSARNSGHITFIPTVPTNYLLAGTFEATGGGFVSMSVSLSEMGAGEALFSESFSGSGDVDFILGQANQGSLSGTLVAGRTYEFSYSNSIVGPSGQGFSANGPLNLTFEPVIDSDGDGVSDALDNCPLVSNPQQEDQDGDTLGDVCDPFPTDPDNEQAQCEADLGESNAALFQAQEDLAACQAQPSFQDADGDGVPDQTDRCPGTPALKPVDDSGCSRAQFCATMAATCKLNDWLNNEPGSKFPGDCVYNKRARTCK